MALEICLNSYWTILICDSSTHSEFFANWTSDIYVSVSILYVLAA